MSLAARLTCHPESGNEAVRAIGVSLRRSAETLHLAYTIEGDLARLQVPLPGTPRIGHALWKRYRRSEMSVEELRRMLGDIEQLSVVTFAYWPLLPAAFDLAMSLDQTVYDCSYLALADARRSALP